MNINITYEITNRHHRNRKGTIKNITSPQALKLHFYWLDSKKAIYILR